jgi:hypothetical protein
MSTAAKRKLMPSKEEIEKAIEVLVTDFFRRKEAEDLPAS